LHLNRLRKFTTFDASCSSAGYRFWSCYDFMLQNHVYYELWRRTSYCKSASVQVWELNVILIYYKDYPHMKKCKFINVVLFWT
jgi:hypothetical protein